MNRISRSRKKSSLTLFEVLLLALCFSLMIPASAFAKKADSSADPAKEKKTEATKPALKPSLIQMAEKSGADKVSLAKPSAETGDKEKPADEIAPPSAPAIAPRIQTPPPHAGFGAPKPAPIRMQTPPPGFNPSPSGAIARPQPVAPAGPLIDKPAPQEEMPASLENNEDKPVKLEEVKPVTGKKEAPLPKKEEKLKKSVKTKVAF